MFQTEKLYLKPDMKISDVILNNPYLILMLEHFGIDTPLQEKLISELCQENNINISLFLTFANLYNGRGVHIKETYPISDILTVINFLKSSHLYYSEEIYPNILSIIQQINSTNKYKEMALIEKFFSDYFGEVSEHLNYENTIVFPYIIDLYNKISGQYHEKSEIKYSVSDYKDHHNDIEMKLNDLKNLLIRYLPLKNDQSTRRKLLFCLFDLENDLNIHSQIEDLILVPMVANLELQYRSTK